jgi:hypothetical protein
MLRSRTLSCEVQGWVDKKCLLAAPGPALLEKAVTVDFRALQIKYNDILLERSAWISIALDTTDLELLLTAEASRQEPQATASFR